MADVELIGVVNIVSGGAQCCFGGEFSGREKPVNKPVADEPEQMNGKVGGQAHQTDRNAAPSQKVELSTGVPDNAIDKQRRSGGNERDIHVSFWSCIPFGKAKVHEQKIDSRDEQRATNTQQPDEPDNLEIGCQRKNAYRCCRSDGEMNLRSYALIIMNGRSEISLTIDHISSFGIERSKCQGKS